MSSNILKCGWIQIDSQDKRIINGNEFVSKRIGQSPVTYQESTSQPMEEQNDFYEPDEEVDALLADEGRKIDETSIGERETEYTGPSVDEMLADAQEEIEQQKQNARNEMEILKQNALEEAKSTGYQEGFSSGEADCKQQFEEQKARLEQEYQQKIRELDDEYERKIEELEPAFVEKLTDIYEHIFQIELSDYKEILIQLIHTALKDNQGNKNFIVRVSKEDYPFVSTEKEHILEELESSEIEIIEDMTLKKNECMIETDGGIFDCSLGTQLSELGKRLRLLSYKNIN